MLFWSWDGRFRQWMGNFIGVNIYVMMSYLLSKTFFLPVNSTHCTRERSFCIKGVYLENKLHLVTCRVTLKQIKPYASNLVPSPKRPVLECNLPSARQVKITHCNIFVRIWASCLQQLDLISGEYLGQHMNFSTNPCTMKVSWYFHFKDL